MNTYLFAKFTHYILNYNYFCGIIFVEIDRYLGIFRMTKMSKTLITADEVKQALALILFVTSQKTK